MKTTPTLLTTAAALAVLTVLTLAGCAQPGPPGGMAGGHRPGGDDRRQAATEDRLAPDPWRAWAGRLRADAALLALDATQQPLYDAFVRDLDDVARQRSVRLERAMRGQPMSVSVITDIGRDLRREGEDADDWRQALADLRARWEPLHQALRPEQLARVEASYRDSQRVQMARGDADDGPGGAASNGPGGRRPPR